MAYVSQELKKQIAPKVKAICEKYGIKATMAVSSSKSTLVLNIKSGKLDFIGNVGRVLGEKNKNNVQSDINYISVNPYWYHEHFDGECVEFLKEVLTEMNRGNHDNSDVMTDYFDVGWYVDINIGNWNKPYILN